MEIKRLELKDVNFYREIRLEALKFHPEAFSTSYEGEAGIIDSFPGSI